MNYIKRNYGIISAGILFIVCFLLYFINIANYPFIDTDETKFVSIAKDMLNCSDWINIKLNGEILYEYNPLYFWITNLSCFIMGKISPESVRLPVSLFSLAGILFGYFSISKILTKTYAFIISIILAASFGTIIFSRLATNDMLFCTLTMIDILFAYLILLQNNEKNKQMLWIFVYFFMALSVLCSGLFGILIPLTAIIGINIFSGNLKEIFKPKNLIPGVILFIIITFPWYLIMIIKHRLIFLKEYFSVYNFLRYTGLKNISVVIGLFMLGFSPWIFSFLWILGSRARSILDSIINYFLNNSQDKLKEKWNKLKKIEKFLSVNIIVFFFSFIYALLYGAKYTFTILFLMFPAACIAGHYWYEYLIKKKHAKSIFFATIIPDIILIICSLVGLFGHNILNKWLFQGELKHLLIPLIVIFFVIPVIGIFAVILKGKRAAFISNIILMLTLSFVITPGIFNFISKTGGENDLIQFAQIANKDKVKLAAYIPSQKYSLIYYYDSKVIFNKNDNIKWLADFLKENPNAYVVTEIKELWNIEENNVKYMLLDAGTRYAMIQNMPYDMRQEETEPEIIVY